MSILLLLIALFAAPTPARPIKVKCPKCCSDICSSIYTAPAVMTVINEE